MIKQQKKSIPLAGFIAVIVLGYLFFFTSRVWLGDSGDLIQATPLYQKQPYETYELYLTEWKYVPEQDCMQMILEFENNELLDETFAFSLLERTYGEIPVTIKKKTSEYAVLRAEEVPEKWKELSLHVGFENDENCVKFYTNRKSVERAEALPEVWEEARLLAQIRYDDVRIAEEEAQIRKLCQENERLAAKEKELKSGAYLSEEEMERATELVIRIQNEIVGNEAAIGKCRETIGHLEKRSETIRKQLEELHQKEEAAEQ